MGNEDEVNFLNISVLNIIRNIGGYCFLLSIFEGLNVVIFKMWLVLVLGFRKLFVCMVVI